MLYSMFFTELLRQEKNPNGGECLVAISLKKANIILAFDEEHNWNGEENETEPEKPTHVNNIAKKRC